MNNNLLSYYFKRLKTVICLSKQAKAAKLFLKMKYDLTTACYEENRSFIDKMYNDFHAPDYYDWDHPSSHLDLDEEVNKSLTREAVLEQARLLLTPEGRAKLEQMEREEIPPAEVRKQAVLNEIENFAQQHQLPKLAA